MVSQNKNRKIIIALLFAILMIVSVFLVFSFSNNTQTAHAGSYSVTLSRDAVTEHRYTGYYTSTEKERATMKVNIDGGGTNYSGSTIYNNSGNIYFYYPKYSGVTDYHYIHIYKGSAPSCWWNRTNYYDNESSYASGAYATADDDSFSNSSSKNSFSITSGADATVWYFNDLPDGTYYLFASHEVSRVGKSAYMDVYATMYVSTGVPTIACYTTGGSYVSNGGITNSSIYFTWSDGNSSYGASSAILNGNSSYSKNSNISAEGTQSIVLTAPSGNTRSYSVRVDKTAPVGSLTGVSNGGITKGNVSFSWTESGCSATLNGSGYTNGTTISAEGYHTIVLTDTAGNSTTYTFTIDKTAPTGTLTNVTNGGYTNKNVKFSWSDSASAKLNGSAYSSGSEISTERAHTIVLTDTAGNSTTYTFTIDKTPPEAKLIAGSQYLDSADFTNKSVSISWSESNLTCTKNTANLSSITELNNATVSAEGYYSFSLADRAGNSTTYTFTIDKTAPVGTLTGVSNGGDTKGQVYFTWEEANCTATLNGSAYSSGSEISTERAHTIVLTDNAGNSSTYTFTIDKTAPVGTLTGVSNGGITNKNVSLSWTDIKNSATLNGSAYSSGATISAEGYHSIVLTDKAGNSTTYTFTIDKTAPTGTLTNVTNGGKTNQPVTFIWTEANCNISLNGNPLSYTLNSGEYVSEQIITALDTRTDYTLVLTDTAGNKTEYTFIIDRRVPTGTIITVKGDTLTSGAETNQNIRFNLTNTNHSATVNGSTYTSGTVLKGVDDTLYEYVFIVRDDLGNENTYNVFVNKIRPKIEFVNNGDTKPVKPNETFYFNKDLILFFDSSCSVKVNGEAFTSGSSIKAIANAETLYDIVITNDADNTNTYSIVLDTIPYTANYNYFLNNYRNHINKWWETFDYSLTNGAYIRSQNYSFSSYDDCLTYAQQRELGIAEYHEAYLGGSIYCNYSGSVVAGTDVANTTLMLNQPYYIYKDINSANKLIAYFNITNLYNAINYYANSSIQAKNIPSTPSPEFQGNENISKQAVITDYIYVKGYEISLPNTNATNTLIINGNVVDYSFKLVSGVNMIKEIDRAGNETIYYLMLDTDTPTAKATDFANNLLTELSAQLNSASVSDVYYNKQFRLFVNDMIDANALLSVTYNGITTLVFGQDTQNYYDFNTSGVYSLLWRDIAGNVRELNLHLILELPEIKVIEILDSNNTLSSFKVEITTKASGQIWSISVYIYDETNGVWVLQSQDTNGVLISKDTLNYDFASNGKYKIEIIDRFGESITTEYIFLKNAPTGTLYDDDNLALVNGARVNAQVRFTWTDTYASATLNGEPYTKDVYIVASGEYVIVLTDRSGNSTTYTFTIDKTAPVYEIVGVSPSGTTNGNVTVSWDSEKEKGTTAVIKVGNGKYNIYTSGAEITEENSYTIILTDIAGNITTINFKIDKTAPDIVITNSSGKVYTNMSIVNTSIKITWQGSATVYINGSLYQKDSLISAEGTYNISLIDSYGNTNSARIKIDKTAPVGTLSGVLTNGFALGDVTLSWTEANCTATLNGEAYTSGTIITDDGEYTIILTDTAGNSSTYTFTIDTVAPTGIFSDTSGNKFDNNFYTNKSIRFSYTVNATATLNGEAYTSGTAISKDGEYLLVLTDKAGNSTTYTFTIDRTAPTGTLAGVSDKGYTNTAVTFAWEEANCTATLNGQVYSCNSIIDNSVGSTIAYTLILTDRAGNSTTYTFTIDKTAPVATFTDSLGTTLTQTPFVINKTVKVSWTESGCTATLNGEAYTSGTVISQDSEYTFIIFDRAGNSTTYTFTIDRSKPSFNLLSENNSSLDVNNIFFNYNIKFDWTDEAYTATLNDAPYDKNTVISAEGNYTLIIFSQAGNSTTYTFTIDKTAPVGTLTGVENGACSNKNVSLSWTENSCTATLNGEAYTSGTAIKADGYYTLILTDRAGNSSTYTFTIYTQALSFTIEGVNEYNYSNSEFFVLFDSAYHKATLNGNIYNAGTTISAEGEYTLTVTNLAGVGETIKITIDKTAPTISFVDDENENILENIITYPFTIKHISTDIKEILVNDVVDSGTFYSENKMYLIKVTDYAGNISFFNITVDSNAPTGDFNVDFVDGKTNKTVIFSWFEENATATLNGEAYTSGTEISEEGNYTLVLTDALGNSTTYTFTIDKTAPVAMFYLRNGETVESGSTICTDVRLEFSYIYSATLNGEAYSSNTYLRGTDDASVLYEITLSDRYGNKQTFVITINRKAPEIIETYEEEFISNENKIFTWEDERTTATLNGEAYTSGTEISEEGDYTLILRTEAGKTKTYTFTIDKTAPTCEMKNLQENGYVITYTQAYWEDFSTTATLNGEPYTKNTSINKDGEYTLILTDKAGNSSTYSFIVDRSEIEAKILINEEEQELKSKTYYSPIKLFSNGNITINGEAYTANTELGAGEYTAVITLKSGRTETFDFTIKIAQAIEEEAPSILINVFAIIFGSATVIFVVVVLRKNAKSSKRKII